MHQSVERDRDAAQSQGFSLREFVHDEAFGGILLLVCALVALIWANAPWGETYEALWATELTLGTVQYHLTTSLRHWVNDGLMAIFFFVVGLEIKRELLVASLIAGVAGWLILARVPSIEAAESEQGGLANGSP